MRKIIFVLLSLIALGATFMIVPTNMQNEWKDGLKRLTAPTFILPPNQMKMARQDDWVAEYRRRGYELSCYGNLRPEEQVTKDDDYNCWGIIKSAYDNIPARMIVFWFGKGELQHIKIEFPEESFTSLQDYLARHFSGVTRLDQSASGAIGTDVYGKALMAWRTPHGLVVTSGTPTPGQPLSLLWISNEKLLRDLLAGQLSREKVGSKAPLQTPRTPPISATVSSASAITPQPTRQSLLPSSQTDLTPATEPKAIAKPKVSPPNKRKPSDLRYCLDLQTDDAIAKCANESR